MHISIIVPIYNEGNIIKSNIKKISNFFKKNYDYEIILIDDGSKDNTLEVLNSIKGDRVKVLFNQTNKGKGYSIKKGIEHSKGKIILTTDADMSARIEEFNKLLNRLKKGYDFVIGSRSKNNSIITIKQSAIRIFLGSGFNFLVKIILGLNYKDTQCGFKLYDSIKIKSIISSCIVNRFCSDVEFLYLAKLNQISVYEEGIVWDDNKNSKVNILKDPINMFLDLIKIKLSKY